MKLIIEVIEQEGKKLFLYEGSTFNYLHPTRSLWEYRASLTITRNGNIFDHTTCIRFCGAHDEGFAFCDLHELGKEVRLPNGDSDASCLVSKCFKVRDLIVIEVPIELTDKDVHGQGGILQNIEEKYFPYVYTLI